MTLRLCTCSLSKISNAGTPDNLHLKCRSEEPTVGYVGEWRLHYPVAIVTEKPFKLCMPPVLPPGKHGWAPLRCCKDRQRQGVERLILEARNGNGSPTMADSA